MRRKIDWERQIGRRLRFRDLHVFFTVVDRGSMARAAADLGVSIPTVSEVIADLEHGLGVRLLDRGPRGVELTVYGRAFLKRGLTAFDELKQGIRDIEFLADPAVGELRIGCDESISAATLPLIIERFSEQYPGVVVDVDDLPLRVFPPDLREHGYDLVVTRLRGRPLAELQALDELNVEVLFNDDLVVAAGAQSRWGRRRKIDLAELAGARWILAGPETWNYVVVAEAFRKHGLPMPKIAVKSLSVHIRVNLLAGGEFITALPRSVFHLYADRFALKVLPIELPLRPWPVILLTLKNRTLTPVVERFIACTREVGQRLIGGRVAVD
jgi:DNA-binding transcriptional LysR family regulator